jgi:PAS domain S-box-containing protein
VITYISVEEALPKPEIDVNLFKYLILGVRDHAIFALDPNGIVITWNLGAERINGYTADEIIGSHFSTFYTEEARQQNHPAFELAEALKDGSYEEEGWRVRKNGARFWANVVLTAIYDDTGRHIGFAKVTRDLTERKSAREATIKSTEARVAAEDTFDLMVAAIKDYAIFVLSPTGIVKTWNQGAERIKGYKADEIIGKHFSIFYTEEAKNIQHPAFELAQAIEKGSFAEEGWRVRKDGTQIWASVTITRILAADGSLVGFIKVTRDLTERKQNEIELERARDEALMAIQLKSKFVANVTHEIRTPLSGIVGLSQLIADEKEATDDIRDSGNRIFQASKQLLAIVNDLLDFAKLEAGKVEVENIPYRIARVIDEVRGLCHGIAEAKSLVLTASVDSALPKRAMGDPNKIRQILLNLVGNSIKFTESGGIDLTVEKQTNSLLFSVTDTGLGVSPEIQSKLFKPFIQAHESTSRLFGGTGLGLSIAQQFVELMGGTIGMVSEVGKGTTVWFSLPLVQEVSAEL